MKFPLFITNFKSYPQATGAAAVELVRAHEVVAKEFPDISVVCSVSAYDIAACNDVADSVIIAAQHTDTNPKKTSSSVGFQLPVLAKNSGAQMTILNHSAHRLDSETIVAHVQSAQEVGFSVVLCAESVDEVRQFTAYNPDAIAYEPPELIGSSDTSVSRSQPDIIKKAVDAAGNIPLLVGAGVSTAEDITIAMQLGAQGFLVASVVVKAENPEEKLRELIKKDSR